LSHRNLRFRASEHVRDGAKRIIINSGYKDDILLDKDDIPLDDIPLDDIPLDDIPLDDIPLDDIPLDDGILDDDEMLDDDGMLDDDNRSTASPDDDYRESRCWRSYKRRRYPLALEL